MLDGVNGAANARETGLLRAASDLPEAERAKGVALLLVRAVRGLELRDAKRVGHYEASTGSAVSAVSAGLAPLPSPVPSTSATDRPRSFATSSGERRFSSAVTVAFTRLIGFCDPSDFDSTSRIPASSSTARTPPPAMTPVPSEAGFRKTRPAP